RVGRVAGAGAAGRAGREREGGHRRDGGEDGGTGTQTAHGDLPGVGRPGEGGRRPLTITPVVSAVLPAPARDDVGRVTARTRTTPCPAPTRGRARARKRP